MTRISVLLSLGLAGACSALVSSSSRDVSASNGGFLSFPIQQASRGGRARVSRRAADTGVPLFNVSFVSYLIERKFFSVVLSGCRCLDALCNGGRKGGRSHGGMHIRFRY